MYYSAKRQAFLVDQGYAFKVITHLAGIENLKGLKFSTQSERLELLTHVMIQNEDKAGVEKIDGDLFSSMGGAGNRKKGVRRTAGALSELSGGQGMAYVEYQKSKNKELKGKGPQNAFMRKLKREQQRKKEQR